LALPDGKVGRLALSFCDCSIVPHGSPEANDARTPRSGNHVQATYGSVIDLSSRSALLLIAPFVGSFLGVLIRRLPERRPIGFVRSQCEHCGGVLTARDLVPLASYLWLRGRCRQCGQPIGAFHPMVELAAAGVALWAILAEPDLHRTWVDCLLGWTLLVLGWIDWRWMRLPDVLTLPLLVAGLLLTLAWQPDLIGVHAAGAAIGYLGLRGIAWAYRLLRGVEGMGAGDAKLLGAAGAWLGVAPLPVVVLVAALLGLATAGLLALSGRKLQATTAMPFGPCLAMAFWLVWLYGQGR
jgi:leader peptidase (prepilin peptidase)/N-methyltransferase